MTPQEKIARLQRRLDGLNSILAVEGTDLPNFRAEASALEWAIAELTEDISAGSG